MFGRKAHNKPQNRIDSLIGPGTRIEGSISFTGGLRVDGHIRGNVVAAGEQSGTLALSERAVIEGEIRVSHGVVNGTVIGPLHASEYLELQAKAKVTGDVYYKSLEIHPGAVVEGNLVHREGQISDKVVAFKPATGD